MKHFTTFLILLALWLCDCSEATRPPGQFLQQLSTADSLEATNSYYAFGTSITGADVRSFITAIASAKKKTYGTGLDWANPQTWDLEFYAGTNHLAGLLISHEVFNIGHVEYSDANGVTMRFWERLETNRTTPNTALEPTPTAP